MRVAAIGVLPALVLGLSIMFVYDAPWTLLLINLLSAIFGFLFLFLCGKQFVALTVKSPFRVASAVLCLEFLTLAVEGVDGVHRWLSLGGIRLHPAAIGDPILLLTACVFLQRRRTCVPALFVTAALSLHIVQPDAGQATALAAGIMVLSLLVGLNIFERFAIMALAAVGPTLAWLRPDPLQPVDMVENILSRAFELHPVIGVFSIGVLAMLPGIAILQIPGASRRRDQGLAFSVAMAAYLLANILVVIFGNFPTPVLGFGASQIFGAILGLGLLPSFITKKPPVPGDPSYF